MLHVKEGKKYNLLFVISFRETMNVFNFSNYQKKTKERHLNLMPRQTSEIHFTYCIVQITSEQLSLASKFGGFLDQIKI